MDVPVLKNSRATFSPELHADDTCAMYWMRQVTIRLRREILWQMHAREKSMITKSFSPLEDRATASLSMYRYREEKQEFYRTDPTARYFCEQLNEQASRDDACARGSFGWVINELELDDTAAFVLALGLLVGFDNAAGSVIAACLNDPTQTRPTLALAQNLWDFPDKILDLADSTHPLFRIGLLHCGDQRINGIEAISWDSQISVPPQVLNYLLFPGTAASRACEPIQGADVESTLNMDQLKILKSSLRITNDKMLRIVPICGARGADFIGTAQQIAEYADQKIVRYAAAVHPLQNSRYFDSLATVCWLQGVDLLLDYPTTAVVLDRKKHPENWGLPLQSIPITLYLSIIDRRQIESIPDNLLLPTIDLPRLSYNERLACWTKSLGARAEELQESIIESSRRFRYEKKTIETVSRRLAGMPAPISRQQFNQTCRLEAELDIGNLAQKVTPRFFDEKLILHRKQSLQLEEIERAMNSLTVVHYKWGTARVWNEGGISVLFAGSSGTGKTMAAEILAIKLDLPMYRVDLSQVVNKYIGETEKNLKALFDAAETSDVILFFDEADSLFGRRTEVKDAHDRYANLEISYLLDRMERFKGLAILASNRKKDLDEAFLRRLRFIVDFSLPGLRQRQQIWRQVIPGRVDCSLIDFDFLARQFPLTGGHCRSIIFNACLQSAGAEGVAPGDFRGQLTMPAVITAVKREYDKLNRPISPEQFGKYAAIVKQMEQEPNAD